MSLFESYQSIRQLEIRKGGYYYLKLAADTVENFPKKRKSRLICVIDETLSFSCGLNHYGDGNYFIIVASRHLKKLNKQLGDEVKFEVHEDPNPLGVEIPEVLQVLLDQDPALKSIFDRITDGKKRSLIYQIKPIRNVDLQVEKILKFLQEQALK